MDKRPTEKYLNKAAGIRRKENVARRRMYTGAAPMAEDMVKDMTIQDPVSNQGLETHVLVPLLTGFFLGAVIGLVSYSFYGARPAALVFAAVFLLSWLWRVGAADGAMHRIENWTGYDIDGDGHIGDPQVTEIVLNLTEKGQYDGPAQNGGRVQRFVLPMSEGDLKIIAHRIAAGQNINRDTFVRGTGVTQEKYNDMVYPEMLRQGLVQKDGGKNTLTDKGRLFWASFGPPQMKREAPQPPGIPHVNMRGQ